MIKKLVCGLLVLSSLGFGLLLAADAFTGTWQMNAKKSKFSKGTELKAATVTVAEQGDNAMVTVKATDRAGKAVSMKYTIPLKGGAVKYTEGGPAAGTTVMAKRIDPNTMDSTVSANGKQVATSHAALSADGRTLTMTRKGADEKGKTVESVEVYSRQ